VRDDPLERGSITEERVLLGNLKYPEGFVRLLDGEERIDAMHQPVE
jgi:hypothetical protein